MSNANRDYIDKYNIVWTKDLTFSRKLMVPVKTILDKIRFPKKIRDNEGTALDLKGYDLTIPPLQIGVRIRRYDFNAFDEFTEDDKEKNTMNADYYFFGYANKDETDLYSYIIFNHHDFAEKRRELETNRQENKKHSAVPFTCYSLWKISNLCEIIALKGNIAFKSEQKQNTKKGHQKQRKLFGGN